jgi:hypothetical protein
MAIIQTLRLSQEDPEFEGIMGYIVRSCLKKKKSKAISERSLPA